MTSFVNRFVTYKDGIVESTACVVADQETLAIHPAATAYAYYLSKEKNAPITTVRTYMTTVARFLSFVAQDPNLGSFDKVEDKHLRAFIEGIVLGKQKLSARTANLYISHIDGFYEYCFDRGFVDARPRCYLSERAQRLIDEQQGKDSSIDIYDMPTQYIANAEFADLLSYVSAKSVYAATRDDLVLQFGYHCGMRAHEITLFGNLTIPRIQKAISVAEKKGEDGFELTIMGKGDKAREIKIPEHLKRAVQRFINGPRRNVPGDALICKKNGELPIAKHASNVFNDAKKALIQAGKAPTLEDWIRNEEKRSFHSLRHSYATNLADFCNKNGLSYKLLADRMGHEGDGRAPQTLTYIHFAAKKRGDSREADSTATRILANVTRHKRND